MDLIRPVPPAPAAPPVEPPRPVGAVGTASERHGLAPAVAIALSPDAQAARGADKWADKPEPDRRGFERDADSQTVVFRISDAVSGDVIVQIPDEVVLKARAYSRQDSEPLGGRIETRA